MSSAAHRGIRHTLPISAQSSEEVKWIAIAQYYFYDLSLRDIASFIFRSPHAVWLWYHNFELYGHPTKAHPPARSLLGEQETEFIRQCFIENPTMYLDELRDALKAAFKVEVSLATLCRVLYLDLSTYENEIAFMYLRVDKKEDYVLQSPEKLIAAAPVLGDA